MNSQRVLTVVAQVVAVSAFGLSSGCGDPSASALGSKGDDFTESGCHAKTFSNHSPDSAIEGPDADDGESARHTFRGIAEGANANWYSFQATDTTLQPLQPVLLTLFEGIELCAFVPEGAPACLFGTPASAEGWSGCCAETVEYNGDRGSYAQLDLDTTFGDDSSPVFVRVRSTTGTEAESCYLFAYAGSVEGEPQRIE